MTALVLDTGAVLAIAAARLRPERAKRAFAALDVARHRRIDVLIPTPVLAECYRGGGTDAAIDHVVARIGQSTPPTLPEARLAGGLLARHQLDSCHLVDALVVACAVAAGGGLVATGDPYDIERLAGDLPRITVVAV
jgi:predicted nucleic acid-binding protein